MRTKIVRFAALIATAFAMLGCSYLGETNGAKSVGGISLALVIPGYPMPESQSGSSARAIAPQTQVVKIYLDKDDALSAFYAAVNLADFASAVEGSETVYSKMIEIPARIYSSLKVIMFDGADSPLTIAVQEGPITVGSGAVVSLAMTAVPYDPPALEPGKTAAGTLAAGSMVFYKLGGAIGTKYAVSCPEALLYSFSPMGSMLAGPGASLTVTPTVTGIYYIGVFSQEAVSFNVSLGSSLMTLIDHPVITEFSFGGGSNFGLEVFNPGPGELDMIGWRIVLQQRYNYSFYNYGATLELGPAAKVPAGGHIVFCPTGFNNLSNTNPLNVYAWHEPTELYPVEETNWTTGKVNYAGPSSISSSNFAYNPDVAAVTLYRRETVGEGEYEYIPVDFFEIGGRSILPAEGVEWDLSGIVSYTWNSSGFSQQTFLRAVGTLEDGITKTYQDSNTSLDWKRGYGTLGFANDATGDQTMSLYLY